MITKKTTNKKERRCLKFTGYIYLPMDNADFNEMRYHSMNTAGRLILFDEKGEKQQGKAIAFTNVGDMLNNIEQAKKKIIQKRVKNKK